MGAMKRTTVTLPDDLAARLEHERHRRAVPAAEIIRQALTAYLSSPEASPEAKGGLPFIGIGRSGRRDTAREAEEILQREWGRAGRR
jgi:predicted transcriptional regulator